MGLVPYEEDGAQDGKNFGCAEEAPISKYQIPNHIQISIPNAQNGLIGSGHLVIENHLGIGFWDFSFSLVPAMPVSEMASLNRLRYGFLPSPPVHRRHDQET